MDCLDREYNGDLDWNVCCFNDKGIPVLSILENAKESGYYTDNFKYAFGAPPCKFNSGRVALGDKVPLSDFTNVLNKFNALGIGCRLTFQSTIINKNNIDDVYCNELLQALEENNANNRNGVILSSDILFEHIRKNYPSLHIISSLVKPAIEVGLIKDTSEYYNELLKRFDTVVVGTSRVFDDGFLDSLDDIGRIEVIVNSQCLKNCPFAGEHYRQISVVSEVFADSGYDMNFPKPDFQTKPEVLCMELKKKHGARNTLMLSREEINRLISKGVRHFKIEGREYCVPAILTDIGRYVFDDTMFYKIANRSLF